MGHPLFVQLVSKNATLLPMQQKRGVTMAANFRGNT
jgi:hypothetical protein